MNIDTETRLAQLRERFETEPFDTFMVLVSENRRYLSGYTAEDGQFDETAGVLLISADDACLVTDSRYDLQASMEAPLFKTIRFKQELFQELPDILDAMGTKILGFESIRLSFYQHGRLLKALSEKGSPIRLIPTQDFVENLRIRKEALEINAIRSALNLTESVFRDFLSEIKPGKSEKALAWELEKSLRNAGAEDLSFPSIIASGPNAALPHAIPSDRLIQKNEPILFDFGIRLNGYCSDISRMVIIGSPDERYHKIYSTVLEAQQKAISTIKPGQSSKHTDRTARDHITDMGYGDHFGHGLGHGVGLAIHEAPRLNPIKDTPLLPGMVTTVEPGIYIPEWGGVRLENMVVVTDSGVEVLNETDPSDMIVL